MRTIKSILVLALVPISVWAKGTPPVQTDSRLCQALRESPMDLEKVRSAIDGGDNINVYCRVMPNVASSAFYLSLEAVKASNGDLRIPALLIKRGAAWDFENQYPKWKHTHGLISNFATAIVQGQIDLVNLFMAQKPDLKSPLGQEAVAASFGHQQWSIASLLLASGANKYQLNGNSALLLAIQHGAPTDFLDALFANWNFQYDNTDLTDGYLAAMLNQSLAPIYLQKIINQGADIHSIKPQTYLPNLLGKGVNRVNALTYFVHTQPYGATPAHLEVARYLLALGMNPNEGQPLLVPTYNNIDLMNWLVFLLLENGANPNVVMPLDKLNPRVNFSALQLAIYGGGGGSLELIKALIDYGADINYVTNTNGSPLCFAVGTTQSVGYKSETAMELIRRGADVNGPCGNVSILCRARQMLNGSWKGAQDVYNMLLDHGALLGDCRN